MDNKTNGWYTVAVSSEQNVTKHWLFQGSSVFMRQPLLLFFVFLCFSFSFFIHIRFTSTTFSWPGMWEFNLLERNNLTWEGNGEKDVVWCSKKTYISDEFQTERQRWRLMVRRIDEAKKWANRNWWKLKNESGKGGCRREMQEKSKMKPERINDWKRIKHYWVMYWPCSREGAFVIDAHNRLMKWWKGKCTLMS